MAPSPARTLRALVLLLCFLLAPLGACSVAGPTLSWPYLLMHLEAQPELAAAQAEAAAAGGTLRAIGLPNPEFEFARGRAEALAGESGEGADTWELSVSLPLRPRGPW